MTRPALSGAAAVGVTLLVWLAIAGAVAVDQQRDRAAEIEKARAAAAATTALMEAHTARTFQVIDLALRDIAERLAEGRRPRNDVGLHKLMQERLRGMPYVRNLFVIDPDGSIRHDTNHPQTPAMSLADREYFIIHRDHPGQLTSISGPLQSRTGAGWFVAATHRIGDGREFRGVVVAAIQLDYFADLYRRIGLGGGQQIVLFHRDGRLIAQYPLDGRIGQTYADYPLFRKHLPQRPRGVYITAGPPLPFERIFSYEAVTDEPLVVGLGHDLREVLAPWKRAAVSAAAGLGVLLVLMLTSVMLFLHDLRRRHRQRERQMQGEKMEALGQLTGGIAHDFANLISIVSGNLEIVRRAAADSGPIAGAVARAQRALDNGAQMTHQLLSFARARTLAVTEVDLHALLDEVLPLLQQAAGSGVTIELARAPGAAPCRVDGTQLEMALINLVVNARDAMGGHGHIVLRTQRVSRQVGGWRRRHAEPMLDLSVEDDGPGMPEAVRRRALEPFFTTKGEAGTGLGLAQVHGLLHQLGGEVEIDSRFDCGTRVHLLLPIPVAQPA